MGHTKLYLRGGWIHLLVGGLAVTDLQPTGADTLLLGQ